VCRVGEPILSRSVGRRHSAVHRRCCQAKPLTIKGRGRAHSVVESEPTAGGACDCNMTHTPCKQPPVTKPLSEGCKQARSTACTLATPELHAADQSTTRMSWGVRTGSAREATHAHLRALRAPWCTCLLCLARHDSRETTCRGSVGSVVAHNVISWSGEQLTFRMPCAWKRWRAGELCHPTGHERMRSPTLQTLQDPILLALPCSCLRWRLAKPNSNES
jgi:hypothetical protein